MIQNDPAGPASIRMTLLSAALTTALLLTAGAACGPRALERFTLPVDRAAVEITADGTSLMRSVYCDISVAPIEGPAWHRLLRRGACSGPAGRAVDVPIPPLTLFHVIVRSTVNLPVRVERAELRYDEGTISSLGVKEMRDRFSSSSYSACDPAILLSFRRLLEEHTSPGAIDYRRDTIESKLDFIPPYDYVAGVVAFERIPHREKRFILRFLIESAGKKRNVDFHFERIERRAGDREKKIGHGR